MRRLALLLFAAAVACQPAAPMGAPAGAGATSPASPSADEVANGVVRLQGCEPRSLLPAAVATHCGEEILRGLFSQLVELDPRTSQPRWGSDTDHAVADRIASIDARRWEIELEEGWVFHDGSPVTSASFVDAWTFAASGGTSQARSFLFEPIVGFDDLHCPEPGCEPATDRFAGLRVIDDRNFEVVLASPDRTFPRRLGHIAFSPLPPAAFEDPTAWGEAPVGNGPFRMDGVWRHDEAIALRAFDGYAGPAPRAAGVEFPLYADVTDAWEDLQAGRLDIADALSPDVRLDANRDFDRVVEHGDVYEFLVVPSHLPALADDDRVAIALSRAIDRRSLIQEFLGGSARPARGLVPPGVSDERDRCGSRCRFDPEVARALLEEAGGLEAIELWVDRDADHGRWVRGIADQWRRHLDLDVQVRALSHTAWLSHLEDRRAGGPHPLAWSMDVPSSLEYLEELHGPSGLFNFDRYVGADIAPRLDDVARSRTDTAARLALLGLERDVLHDMHHIPLWVRTHEAWYGERVEDVSFDGAGRVLLPEITVRGWDPGGPATDGDP